MNPIVKQRCGGYGDITHCLIFQLWYYYEAVIILYADSMIYVSCYEILTLLQTFDKTLQIFTALPVRSVAL